VRNVDALFATPMCVITYSIAAVFAGILEAEGIVMQLGAIALFAAHPAVTILRP